MATALTIAACVASDDDDTTNVTNVSSTTMTSTTAPSDSSGDATNTTTASTSTTSAETTEGSTGEECPADAECQEDTDCGAGGSCIACICVGGQDTAGTDPTSGECPPGEECVMTGAGGMACLAAPDHCVLACGGAMMCPDSMTCQNGACQYDVMMPPASGDANYPLPQPAQPVCPDGYFAVSFGPGDGMYAVCAPACEGTGTDATCPQAETGSALGACLFNPASSQQMCG